MKRIVAVLAALTVSLPLAACSSGHTPAHSAAQHPNIVFVLTDDLSMNLVAAMPHVQQMQRDGMTMNQHYVDDSLCCPSRSSIFTGQFPHDDGVFTNTGDDGGYHAYNANGDEAKSFGPALQRAGYRTGFFGKYLNGYRTTDPVPPGWNEWDVAGNGYPEFNYTLNQNGTQQRYRHRPADYLTDVLSAKASSFVDSSADAHTPFMLEVATFAPHAPYTPAPRDAGTAATQPYPRTAAYDTLPSAPPAWLRDRPALSSRQQQQILTAYRKRVEAVGAVDDLIGHLQDELRSKGLDRDTYVVFSSDNGYHMGEYRLMPGKQTAFDTDIHVPLVVTGPGVPAGGATDRLTSNVDFAPTFETLAGAAVPPTVGGTSLDALWHGSTPSDWRQAVLVEHHGPNNRPDDPDRQGRSKGIPPSYEAVRTAGALYVHYANGEQEYYDTTKDPNELHNLGASAVPPPLARSLSALQGCHGADACTSAARS